MNKLEKLHIKLIYLISGYILGYINQNEIEGEVKEIAEFYHVVLKKVRTEKNLNEMIIKIYYNDEGYQKLLPELYTLIKTK